MAGTTQLARAKSSMPLLAGDHRPKRVTSSTSETRSVSATLRELDLTETLADLVWQLDPAAGPQSRRTLAARLHCDPSNVTLLVDRLEVRGLVESRPDSNDRRVKAIALTPKGRQARARLVATTADSPTFARLSQTER